MNSNSLVTKAGLIFSGLLLILVSRSVAQPNYPRSPDQAALVYDDLKNFVNAYNELQKNTDSIAVLQTYYFDRGTAGLKEFISRHNLTPELLLDAITKNPERYALIAGFLANIGEVEATYKEMVKAFDSVVPDAMYPPTYLLVGANRGIGQASQQGQLITITRVVDDPNMFGKITIHELSHFQQALAMGGQKYAALYDAPDNMLGLCLREGGAEFITYLVLGDITQHKALDYLEKDEQSLKEKFLQDLETQQKDFWLWESIGQKEYPKLLGYAMGFKICKHYYEQAEDETEALRSILQMPDAEDFLASSHYFER